jgi:hypothetical protein
MRFEARAGGIEYRALRDRVASLWGAVWWRRVRSGAGGKDEGGKTCDVH